MHQVFRDVVSILLDWLLLRVLEPPFGLDGVNNSIDEHILHREGFFLVLVFLPLLTTFTVAELVSSDRVVINSQLVVTISDGVADRAFIMFHRFRYELVVMTAAVGVECNELALLVRSQEILTSVIEQGRILHPRAHV